ncbi:hypothetical protein FB45DRAFT_1063890 [Roridomyces roridus]|uniref:Uncharacterized protein n=1 Tax=Roridomyces roridus TaxID=1738132 RepID=A0AAD7BBQ6_9AGAR|nr:hypothetical protein FB45DRAFT_1063890 [Roridomyces roridus]
MVAKPRVPLLIESRPCALALSTFRDLWKGFVIDWIQSESFLPSTDNTQPIAYGGVSFPIYLRHTVGGISGALVSLDALEPSDPILVNNRPGIAGPRGSTVLPHDEKYIASLPDSAQCNLELQLLVVQLYNLNSTRYFLWEAPKCMVGNASWGRALWRLLTEDFFLRKRAIAAGGPPSLQGRFTYESLMAEIEKDVGRACIQLRSALRVPLPPAAVDELYFKPIFQSLVRSSNTSDLMHAVIGIIAFDDPLLCFPALTPDCLLFKPDEPTAGFILDLDLPEEPGSITHCIPGRLLRRHAASTLRFAAYDRITPQSPPPPDTLHPRHALESLFNALVWTAVCKNGTSSYSKSTWLSTAPYNLPQDRTKCDYLRFVDERRHFLLDATKFWNTAKKRGGMHRVVDSWLVPLWRMISEAQFFAREREEEGRYEWETLGGRFTVEGFVGVLEIGLAI